MEKWRDIKGYEGLYQVSNYGRVKSLKYNREKILKPSEDINGYLRISLYNNHHKSKKFRIHKLVAEAFIPNPNKYTVINHKDENPTNNRVDNLEWCTQSYNINYGTRNKRVAEKLKYSNHTVSRKVQCVTTGKKFNCITEAAKYYLVDISHIGDCCSGKRKSSGKHPVTGEKLVWKYID